MKITTKARYAMTLMVDVALYSTPKTPLSLTKISARYGMSSAYLERLAGMLRKQGLLISVRGVQGGYCLGKSATQITLAEIVLAVEENLDATGCGGALNCTKIAPCLTHDIWANFNHAMLHYLTKQTLANALPPLKTNVVQPIPQPLALSS